jgi:YD repeat-containing protein
MIIVKYVPVNLLPSFNPVPPVSETGGVKPMRMVRITFFLLLLIALYWFALPSRVSAQRPDGQAQARTTLNGSGSSDQSDAAVTRRLLDDARSRGGLAPVHMPPGGIKEVIPAKYQERYQDWKNEFLSTETGRSQWEKYEQGTHFTLTIIISCKDRNGAETSKYRWDDAGQLVAATITLGCRIDEGYPNSIYYPVMNALSSRESSFNGNGGILAAAKIAHEFGHINRALVMDSTLYRLQNQLMPAYNKILLGNGRNVGDPRLIELARQMGGTPVEIWEDREYWGEANAMLYLRDRITKQSEQQALFTRIRRSVELYANKYAERFDQIAR